MDDDEVFVDGKTVRLIMICLTAIALGIIGAIWSSCENQSEHRLECITKTSDAGNCRLLFPRNGEN